MIKKANKKNNTEKPVAKCDQSKEVVAKCDHPESAVAICDHKELIKDKNASICIHTKRHRNVALIAG